MTAAVLTPKNRFVSQAVRAELDVTLFRYREAKIILQPACLLWTSV